MHDRGHDHEDGDGDDLRLAELQETWLLYDRRNERAWLRSDTIEEDLA